MKDSRFPLSLVALLVTSAMLLISWSLAVPIFEGPDEPSHWQYMRYVNQNGAPPPYGTSYAEANQPPLYYFLAAPLASSAATPSPLPPPRESSASRFSATNLYEHSARDYELYGQLYAMRLVSIVFSLITILFSYWCALGVSGRPMTGLLAAGLVAFLPQFTSRGMNISNDALLTMLCAIATFWLVRLIERGFTLRGGVAAAITIALAFLARVNAVILIAPFAYAIAAPQLAWASRVKRFATWAITLAIIAPWLIANQIQYGDPLAMRVLTMIVAAPFARPKPITSPYFVTEFPIGLFQSFVGKFGFIMDVHLPNWLYAAFGLFFFAALFGVVKRFVRRPEERRPLLMLQAIPLLSLGTIVYLNLTFSIPFGRYLLPALPALATLFAIGLAELPGWSDDVAMATLVELMLVNVYILLTVVIPAHRLGI